MYFIRIVFVNIKDKKGGVAQWLEHVAYNDGVDGPIPSTPTDFGLVAPHLRSILLFRTSYCFESDVVCL